MSGAELVSIVPGWAPADSPGEALLPGRRPRWSEPARSTLRALRTARSAARRLSETRRSLRRRLLRCEDAAEATRVRALALSRVAAELCRDLGLRTIVRGPLPAGPVVLVANHLGWIDPLLVAGILPCAPIAKAELGSWPFVGAGAREHGVAFVERGNAASGARALLRARHALRAGTAVLNFPEGTTTAGPDPIDFHRGIFGLARRTGTPVVPVAISVDDPSLCWTGDATFLPHFARTAARGGVARIAFGAAMTPARYASPEDLAAEAHDSIVHLLRGGA
jgi:1-acyl-sn-glycerol-3-phosphate acyltransferase